MLLFFNKQTQKQAQIKTKLESCEMSLTLLLPTVLGQFLNREFCPSNYSTPIVLSAEPVVIGAFCRCKTEPVQT